MSFLLRINKYILATILIDWFDLSCFGKLCVVMNTKGLICRYLEIVSEFGSQLRASLFPSLFFVPLSVNAAQWFDKYGFGTPDSLIIDWTVFDYIESGMFALPSWLLTEKYKKRKIDRELLFSCLQKVKWVRISTYSEGKKLRLGTLVERVEVLNGLAASSGILLPGCGPSIRELNFTGFKFDSELYNCQVCRSCPNLTTLTFTRLHAFVQSLLSTLLVHCRRLTTLNISTRDDMDDRWMLQFILLVRRCHVIHLPFTNVTTLRSLLWHCGSVQQSLSMLNAQEAVLDEMVLACPVLVSLTIRGIYSTKYCISSQSLLSLASNLVDLHICETEFSEGYFNSLPECPHLNTLRLHDCQLTSGVLSRILSRCRQIKNLIVGCNRLDDTIEDALAALPHIEKLNIASNSISDKLLFVLAKHCKRLRALDVSSCSLITDEGLCSVMYNGRMMNLNIMDCPFIGVQSFRCIAAHCFDIKYLTLSGTKGFQSDIREDLAGCHKCFTYIVTKYD